MSEQLGRQRQSVSVVRLSSKAVCSTMTIASWMQSAFSGEQISVVSGSRGM